MKTTKEQGTPGTAVSIIAFVILVIYFFGGAK